MWENPGILLFITENPIQEQRLSCTDGSELLRRLQKSSGHHTSRALTKPCARKSAHTPRLPPTLPGARAGSQPHFPDLNSLVKRSGGNRVGNGITATEARATGLRFSYLHMKAVKGRGSREFYMQMIKTKFLITPKITAMSSASFLNGLSQQHLQNLKSSHYVSPGLKCYKFQWKRGAIRKPYAGKLWYKQRDCREFNFFSTLDDFL